MRIFILKYQAKKKKRLLVQVDQEPGVPWPENKVILLGFSTERQWEGTSASELLGAHNLSCSTGNVDMRLYEEKHG